MKYYVLLKAGLLFALLAGAARAQIDVPISKLSSRQTSPAIAFNGRDYVVVWEDSRNGDMGSVYGARVTRAGALVDAAGIAVSSTPGTEGQPAIVSDGKDCLVAWVNNRTGDRNIYATLIAPDGSRPAGEFPIVTFRGEQADPAITFDGKNYVVVWSDHRADDWHIYAARVTPEGKVLEPDGVPLSTLPVDEDAVAAATSNQGTSLVTWTSWHPNTDFDIYGQVTSPEIKLGDPLCPCTLLPFKGADKVVRDVAWDGKDYFLVWGQFENLKFDVYGGRVTADGKVLDTAGIPISADSGERRFPRVAASRTGLMAVWQYLRPGTGSKWHVYGATITPAGYVMNPSGIAIAADDWTQDAPAVASDGDSYFVVWEDLRQGNPQIYGSRVTRDGEVK